MNQVLFMCSSQHVAQNLSSNQTTTSLYQFNYQPDFALWPDYYVESFTKTCSPSETSCHGAELSFIFGNEVNAVSGPTVFSEKDHQAKDLLMSNWLKSKTFEPYSQETDNITVFNEEAYFNVSGDWDNTKNGNVCSQVNEIMNSNTKLY